LQSEEKRFDDHIKQFWGQVLYCDVLALAPLFNDSFDPNIKIKDPHDIN
jgi:hypothetical protein